MAHSNMQQTTSALEWSSWLINRAPLRILHSEFVETGLCCFVARVLVLKRLYSVLRALIVKFGPGDSWAITLRYSAPHTNSRLLWAEISQKPFCFERNRLDVWLEGSFKYILVKELFKQLFWISCNGRWKKTSSCPYLRDRRLRHPYVIRRHVYVTFR